jgi:cell division transport system permease protein
MKTLNLHLRGFIAALIRIFTNPFEHLFSILTIAVIVTTLSITLVINNSITSWESHNISYPQIIVYLKNDLSQNDVYNLENTINKFSQKTIKGYQFISKNEGLEELKQDTTLKQIASDAISNDNNPLPDVLVLNTNTTDVKLLNSLKNHISEIHLVDEVQMDTEYASKISDLLAFVTNISRLLQLAFAFILIIVIYNMIRLQMSLRQDEIIVSRLIGASDSFIMRPLIHYATIQIILGSAIGFALVNLFANYINNLFSRLNLLFGNGFHLSPLNNIQILQLSVFLIIFGILAVFLAVRFIFKNSYVQ